MARHVEHRFDELDEPMETDSYAEYDEFQLWEDEFINKHSRGTNRVKNSRKAIEDRMEEKRMRELLNDPFADDWADED